MTDSGALVLNSQPLFCYFLKHMNKKGKLGMVRVNVKIVHLELKLRSISPPLHAGVHTGGLFVFPGVSP